MRTTSVRSRSDSSQGASCSMASYPSNRLDPVTTASSGTAWTRFQRSGTSSVSAAPRTRIAYEGAPSLRKMTA